MGGGTLAPAPTVGSFESAARQQLERFFQALVKFLQSCGAPGTPMLLSKVASSGPVQAEWAMLQRCSVIGKTTKMKQVILQRPQTFSIVMDNCNQPHVRLVNSQLPAAMLQAAAAIQRAASKTSEGDGKVGFHDSPLPSEDTAQAALANQVPAAVEKQPSLGPLPVGPLPVGLVGGGNVRWPILPQGAKNSLFLRPEQVSAIEAHLRKNNGQERLSKVGSQFGVKKAQLSEHFVIVPFGSDPIIALKKSSAKTSPRIGLLGGLPPSTRGAATGSAAGDVAQELEQLLRRTVPSRHSVCDAMVFCLDHAHHAAPLARRLTASLGEKELGIDSALARLYVVSDVLKNSNCGKPGAARYLTSLQDLLPEAFEQFGREWFRRIESHLERSRAEQRVRSVLVAWQEVTALPPLFVKGLEALFFAPVLEDANAVPSSEPDELLRQKLLRWFSVADQVRLPSACRLRGLAGKALSTAACRARLCHFERYWHRPGVSLAEDEDLFGDNEATARPAAPTTASLPSAPGTAAPADDATSFLEENEPLDGEVLTDEDMAALGLLDGESLFGEDVEDEETPSRALGFLPGDFTLDAEMIFAPPEVIDCESEGEDSQFV